MLIYAATVERRTMKTVGRVNRVAAHTSINYRYAHCTDLYFSLLLSWVPLRRSNIINVARWLTTRASFTTSLRYDRRSCARDSTIDLIHERVLSSRIIYTKCCAPEESTNPRTVALPGSALQEVPFARTGASVQRPAGIGRVEAIVRIHWLFV